AENEVDFAVDTVAPTGAVYDGETEGVDVDFNDGSLNQLVANWEAEDDLSGLASFEYSVGTTPGATDVLDWTNNNLVDTATASSLSLNTSEVYYFNVRATDEAGNAAVISSDGIRVAPTLSFSASPALISFDNLNVSNSYTASENAILTTSTNAYNGYQIRAFISALPTADNL